MTFAEKLRELRQQAGLSEAKLADLSGVSFGAVHNYGLGIRSPTFPAVVKLARALGVTCEAFANCDDIAGEEVNLRGKQSGDGPEASGNAPSGSVPPDDGTVSPKRGRPRKPPGAEDAPTPTGTPQTPAPRKRGRPPKRPEGD